MSKLNICVFFNNLNNDKSIESASYILGVLNNEKYTKIPIYIDESGKWFLYDGPIYDILNNNIEKVGVNTILSPCSTHNGLLRIIKDKNRIIPIDIAISVLFDLGKEIMIRSILENAKIKFIGQNALNYTRLNDDKVKYHLFKGNDIDIIDYKIFNGLVDEPLCIYEQVKNQIKFPVSISKLNEINEDDIIICKNKSMFLKTCQEIFEKSNELIVKSLKGLDRVDILFFDYGENVYFEALTDDITERVLNSCTDICLTQIANNKINTLFIATFYIDKKKEKIFLSDVNNNFILPKNNAIIPCFDKNNIEFNGYLDYLIEREINYGK